MLFHVWVINRSISNWTSLGWSEFQYMITQYLIWLSSLWCCSPFRVWTKTYDCEFCFIYLWHIPGLVSRLRCRKTDIHIDNEISAVGFYGQSENTFLLRHRLHVVQTRFDRMTVCNMVYASIEANVNKLVFKSPSAPNGCTDWQLSMIRIPAVSSYITLSWQV